MYFIFYSQKIIWLELVCSNNHPQIPANLFLDAVASFKAYTMLVRTDCGTENWIIAARQSFFRASGDDAFPGKQTHVYGSNQQIKGWWSFIRCNRSSFWMDLVEQTVLQLDNDFHMECLCFS